MPREPRSTERLINLLETVNGTAIDNNIERGYSVGSHIQELCREAAQRLRTFHDGDAIRVQQLIAAMSEHDDYLSRPACTDGLSNDEIGNHDAGC